MALRRNADFASRFNPVSTIKPRVRK